MWLARDVAGGATTIMARPCQVRQPARSSLIARAVRSARRASAQAPERQPRHEGVLQCRACARQFRRSAQRRVDQQGFGNGQHVGFSMVRWSGDRAVQAMLPGPGQQGPRNVTQRRGGVCKPTRDRVAMPGAGRNWGIRRSRDRSVTVRRRRWGCGWKLARERPPHLADRQPALHQCRWR